MFGKNKIAMLVAEFLGTGILTLAVLAVQRTQIGAPYFVAIAAGVVVGALSLILGNASGAHLNPAITFGAWTARKVKTLPAIMYIVVQLLGAWGAYRLYVYFVNSHFPPTGGQFTRRIMIAEAVGAFIFAFAWAAIAARRLSASLRGAMFGVGMLIASIPSFPLIGLINPALAVGTRAWAVKGWMGWGTYLAGPLLGAMVAFVLYDLLFTDNMLGFRASSTATSAPAVTAAPVVAPAAPAAKRRTATRPKATARRTTTAKRRTTRRA